MPKIIIALQNETIRKRSGDDILLATIGLKSSVAVIIKDQNGNASLTHVDHRTNLEFIKNEIKFMVGKYTIDIVKNTGQPNTLSLVVKEKLKKLGLDKIPNSEGRYDIRDTGYGTVLLQDDKLSFPDIVDFNELMIGKTSNKNALKNHAIDMPTLEEGNLSIYTRQINVAFPSSKEQFPVVTYDNRHRNQNTASLIPEAQKFLDSLTEEIITNSEKLKKAIEANKDIANDQIYYWSNNRHFSHKQTHTSQIIESLLLTIPNYYVINKDRSDNKHIKRDPQKASAKSSDLILPENQEMKRHAISDLNKSLVFWNSVKQKGMSQLESLLYYAYRVHIKTKNETKDIPGRESEYNFADEKLRNIVPMVIKLIKSLDKRFSEQKTYEMATEVATDIKRFDDKYYKNSKDELEALRKSAWQRLSLEEKRKINVLQVEKGSRKKQADTGPQP